MPGTVVQFRAQMSARLTPLHGLTTSEHYSKFLPRQEIGDEIKETSIFATTLLMSMKPRQDWNHAIEFLLPEIGSFSYR
jgi:hypothetical protein